MDLKYRIAGVVIGLVGLSLVGLAGGPPRITSAQWKNSSS
jgi:hypothetical protein